MQRLAQAQLASSSQDGTPESSLLALILAVYPTIQASLANLREALAWAGSTSGQREACVPVLPRPVQEKGFSGL